MKKRSVKTKLLIQLRRLGMLCKKQTPHKDRIRISKTIYPNGVKQMSLNGKHEWYGTQETKTSK
tara:strand:+ start:341 stop:532 length:192 start_codon:yes stop_codon:yes gene_type:complete